MNTNFLDALAQLCAEYGVGHINIDGDDIVFSKPDSLSSFSFMAYSNGKFVGVCQSEIMREYKAGGAD